MAREGVVLVADCELRNVLTIHPHRPRFQGMKLQARGLGGSRGGPQIQI